MRAEIERDYRDGDDADVAEPGPLPEAEQRHFQVQLDEHGERLDKLLVAHADEFSRSHLQGLVERGCVKIDGVLASSSSRRVRAGQGVELTLEPTEESRAYTPEPMALDIRFEDEHLLVLCKPAGRVVHPAPGNWRHTLLNGLLAHHAAAARLPRAGIVHRLDKDTSGLMVVAKSLPAMTALVRAIAARDVQREYLALAHGDVGHVPFSIEAPVGRDPQVRVRMAVVPGGKPARTDVTWLGSGEGVSALRCRLHSGRTHQIRVHLASRGHPLVADALYGGRPALGLERQALHATRLAFAHPVHGRACAYEAPLPDDLRVAWERVLGATPSARSD